ncbi:MAG: beta-propeller domain-containing protein [Lachnospiraceae bacterium]|nr:beta-propeller domain-containing protein [Lachnospiraceae bacterium]
MNNQDLWEKEMEEMIRNTAEKLSVPESLQPESIKQNLLERQKTARTSRNRQIRYWCAVAAMFLLGCGLGVAWTVSGGKPGFIDDGHEMRKTADVEEGVSSDFPEEEQVAEADGEKLTYAKSYQEIQEALEEITQRQANAEKELAYSGFALKDRDAGAGEAKSGSENFLSENEFDTVSSTSHSETNVSVEGILEADKAVTDGDYIYRLRMQDVGIGHNIGCLDIIKADGGTMKLMGKYVCEDALEPKEFFLAGDQLILLSDTYSQGKYNTCITFLNIRDRHKPVKTQELTQTGSYSQARLQDGYLYTVSGSSPSMYRLLDYYDDRNDAVAESGEKDDQIPCLNGKKIPASQIYIPDGCNEAAFTTITSVKLDDPKDFADGRSIVTSSDALHMTEENIYFTTDKWVNAGKKSGVLTKTQLTKFSYHKGKFAGKARKQINGSIKDTFAINEYQGNLRVISSISYNTGKDDNAVYVLDEDLKIIGSIENLAEDERVYSARFQGDIGYFVTYRETDPLFSVDFSDPHNPKILGKLKIPGFSEYMHFYNDHLLFGLGQEVGKNGDTVVKLSMFDISDPTDVKEIHKILLKKVCYSAALYDYKAVLIDPEKNLIGFDGWEDYSDDSQYYVYSYDEEKGFVRRIQAGLADDDDIGEFVRGLYIDDTVYLVHLGSQSIKAYDLNSGKRIGTYPKK